MEQNLRIQFTSCRAVSPMPIIATPILAWVNKYNSFISNIDFIKALKAQSKYTGNTRETNQSHAQACICHHVDSSCLENLLSWILSSSDQGDLHQIDDQRKKITYFLQVFDYQHAHKYHGRKYSTKSISLNKSIHNHYTYHMIPDGIRV